MARGKSGGDRNGVLAFTTTQTPKVGGDVALTLEAASRSGGGQTPAVLAFHHTQTPISGDVAPAIGRTTDGMGVMTFAERGRADGRSVEVRANGVVNSLLTPNGGRSGTGCGDAVFCITGNITHALTHEGADASEDGTGRGTPIVADAVLAFTPGDEARGEGPRPRQDLVQTLGASTQGDQAPHIVCLTSGQANAEVVRDVVGTLDFGGHGGSYNRQDAYQGRILPAAGRPRRLTPLECERLMGWPDRHTAQGIREDGTAYALSDTARYRLCGNGVGTPVATLIGQRLAEAHSL